MVFGGGDNMLNPMLSSVIDGARAHYSSAARKIRSMYVPTSEDLMHDSLHALLAKYVLKSDVETFTSNGGLHTTKVISRTPSKVPKKKLILCHGYGAGSGLFYKNYDALAEIYDVYALDWPGFGASNRDQARKNIPYVRVFDPLLQKAVPSRSRQPEQTVDFFVDSLEAWRKETGCGSEDVVIAGHSMGGFLATRYCFKYPEAVHSLVLMSPAGLRPRPATAMTNLRDRPMTFNALAAAWRSNITPMSLVRASGAYGPGIIHNALSWRLRGGNMKEEELLLLGDYMYHISAAPGAGEYFLNSFLDPVAYTTERGQLRYGMFPKYPLRDDIPAKLGAPSATATATAAGSPSSKRCRRALPILFLYGTKDWMAYEGVEQDIEAMARAGADARMSRIEEGGHNFFLENPKQFHAEMETFARETGIPVSSK